VEAVVEDSQRPVGLHQLQLELAAHYLLGLFQHPQESSQLLDCLDIITPANQPPLPFLFLFNESVQDLLVYF
jgi:hypothetical protein